MWARLAQVTERIERACESVGRDPIGVTLVAVSKTYPVEAIRELYDLGHRDFGESRLQEALPKIAALPDDIRWHMIGKLQSNKAKRAGQVFHAIHTLEKVAQLAELGKVDRIVEGFIEVNLAEERQKSGLFASSLDDFHRIVLHCKQVHFQGLMTVGPLDASLEETRTLFAKLRNLNERVGGSRLSMGMSRDFDVAIQEGATHVRVGSALFGERSA